MSIERARMLRRALTKQETRLWLRLRALRERGFHIRRQAPFRGYYLDFVCFKHRLVIELDGGQHTEEAAQVHDRVRDAVLQREGFRVLRFWNRQVNTEIDAVMDQICEALEGVPPPPEVHGSH